MMNVTVPATSEAPNSTQALNPIQAPNDDSGLEGALGLVGEQTPSVETPMEEDLDHHMQEVDEDKEEKQMCINFADVVTKLGFMVGYHQDMFEVSREFVPLLCQLASSSYIGIGDDGDLDAWSVLRDAATIRRFVNMACNVLGRALRGELPMTMTAMDVLRTAHFCVGSTDASFEYSKAQREQSFMESTLFNVMRGTDSMTYDDTDMKAAYKTAASMHSVFTSGVTALRNITELSDEDLVDLFNRACVNFHCGFVSMVVPLMYDGQRLRAGNEISAKVLGSHDIKYGSDTYADHALNGRGTLYSLSRIQFTAVSMIAMQQIAIEDDYLESNPDIDVGEARVQVRQTEAWKNTVDLISNIKSGLETVESRRKNRKEAASNINCILGCVSEWFDSSRENETSFSLVQSICSARVFTIGKDVPPELMDLWKEFSEQTDVTEVCLYHAVNFLCYARSALHGTVMPLSSAVCMVLSGAIANMVCVEHITGPIVFSFKALRYMNAINRMFPDSSVDGSLPMPPKDELGTTCSKTRIITNILDKGRVRGRHEKGTLPCARLQACFTMLCVKDALMRDLGDSVATVTAAPTESKDMRRLYIIFLQAQPATKHEWCHNTEVGSYLVERCRDGDDGTTTRDNVEKSFRDVSGSSAISTFFFYIAGKAFLYSLMEIVGSTDGFKNLKTDRAINFFTDKLLSVANSVFSDDRLPAKSEKIDGREYAQAVFLVQRSIIDSFCNLIKNQGCIWEALQLTFSIHKTDKDDDADFDNWDFFPSSEPSGPSSPSLAFSM